MNEAAPQPCKYCGVPPGTDHAADCELRNPSVPTVWRTADGRAVRSESPIVPPDETDARMMEQAYNVCGSCKYFELLEGQRLMKAQKFVERLVREDKWKTEHLVSPLNQLGLCSAHDSGAQQDHTITGQMHKACDQYRDDKGRVRSRLRILK